MSLKSELLEVQIPEPQALSGSSFDFLGVTHS